MYRVLGVLDSVKIRRMLIFLVVLFKTGLSENSGELTDCHTDLYSSVDLSLYYPSSSSTKMLDLLTWKSDWLGSNKPVQSCVVVLDACETCSCPHPTTPILVQALGWIEECRRLPWLPEPQLNPQVNPQPKSQLKPEPSAPQGRLHSGKDVQVDEERGEFPNNFLARPSTEPSQVLETTGATGTDASSSITERSSSTPAAILNPSSIVFTTETVVAFTEAITTTQANTGANIKPTEEDNNRSEVTLDDFISGESTTVDRASVDDAEELTIDLEHTTDTPEESSETFNKESEGYLETFIELEDVKQTLTHESPELRILAGLLAPFYLKTDNTASSPEEAASIAAPSSKPKEAITTDASSKHEEAITASSSKPKEAITTAPSSKPEEAITASSSKPKEAITTAAFSKPEESITASSTEHSDDFRRSQSSVKSSTYRPKTEESVISQEVGSAKEVSSTVRSTPETSMKFADQENSFFRVQNEKLEEEHEVLVEKMDGWRGKYFTILGFFVCFIIIFIIIVLVLIIKLKNKKKKSRSNIGSPALSRGNFEEQEPLTPRESERGPMSTFAFNKGS